MARVKPKPVKSDSGCHCEAHIERALGNGWLTRGSRKDGERVRCPWCFACWEHVCDEAEGCWWIRVRPKPPRRKKEK